MKIAGAITNRFTDFQLHNLSQWMHHHQARGPFLITQDGADPSDPHMRACSFVLSRRGTWLHFYLYLALPEEVRHRCFHFESAAAALQCADALPSSVVVENTHSLMVLLEEAGFEPSEADVTGRALYEVFRTRSASPQSESN